MLRRIIDLASFGFMLWVVKVCIMSPLSTKIVSEAATATIICAAIVLTCFSIIIIFKKDT